MTLIIQIYEASTNLGALRFTRMRWRRRRGEVGRCLGRAASERVRLAEEAPATVVGLAPVDGDALFQWCDSESDSEVTDFYCLI